MQYFSSAASFNDRISSNTNTNKYTTNNNNVSFIFEISTRQSILSFFSNQFSQTLPVDFFLHLSYVQKCSRLPVRTERTLVIILYDRKEMWLAILNSNRIESKWIAEPNMVVPLNMKWIFIWPMESQQQSLFEHILPVYRFDENQ